MFCAIIWSSTWIQSSPAPVAADRPSSMKKKQSVCPQRLTLTSSSSIIDSLVSFLTNDKELLDSWRSYCPVRFLLVPSPLGFTATGHFDTNKKKVVHHQGWWVDLFTNVMLFQYLHLNKNEPLRLIYHAKLSTYAKFNKNPLQTYKNRGPKTCQFYEEMYTWG